MEELLQGYGVGQLDAPAAGLRSRLDRDLVEFEDELEQLETDAVPEHDRLSLYQLLGSYRSLAEGMVSFAEAVDDIPWDRMREPRF
jgi:hypothetical protein